MKKPVICFLIFLLVFIVTVVLLFLSSFLPLKHEPVAVPTPNSSSTDIQNGIEQERTSTVFPSQNSFNEPVKDWKYALNFLMPKLEDCGHGVKIPEFPVKRKRRKRIVGGDAIEDPNLFPWIGQIGYKYDLSLQSDPVYGCGCSLISTKYVLTAAHCVNRTLTSRFLVKLRADSELFKVEEIEIHPKYNKEIPEGRIYDLALIRLSRSAKVSDTVCVPLPKHYGLDQNVFDVDSGLVTGYASTGSNVSKTGSETEASLHQVNLSIVSNEECEAFYGKHSDFKRIITSAQFCAGNEIGQDFCKGDSGNPFVVQIDGKYFQRGIASFGTKLCGLGHPGVFIDLLNPSNRHWILQTIRD